MREAVTFETECRWNGYTWVGKSAFKCANGWPIAAELIPTDVRSRLLDEYHARKKDAGGGQIITKAESGVGGKLPPLAPDQRPFDPVAANPYRRSAPSTDQPKEAGRFDPVCSRPLIRVPDPPPEPERPYFPRHDLGLGKETR